MRSIPVNHRKKPKLILRSKTFFWKSCCLWDNLEKYGKARQATDENKIRCRKFAVYMPCIPRARTETHIRNI